MLKQSLRKMSLDLHSGISKLLSSTLCDNVPSTEAQNSKKLVLSIDVICRTSLRISYMRLNEIRSKGNSTNDRQNLTKRDQERDANGSQYEVYIYCWFAYAFLQVGDRSRQDDLRLTKPVKRKWQSIGYTATK